MAMLWQVKINHILTHAEQKEVEAIIQETFVQVDEVFNNWNPHSEISKVNQLAAHEPTELSCALADLLHQIDPIVELTDNRFDPTVEPLQKLYKHYFTYNQLPPKEKLEKISAAIGWDKIHLEGRILTKEHALTAIDLSGVAKGHAVDLICQKLTEKGYNNFYVEWGGEISTQGVNSKNNPWCIAIMGLSTIELKNQAVATSGTYYQTWQIDECNYTHIIDPASQTPLQLADSTIKQVTVLNYSSACADALATACMLFSSAEEANEWAKKHKLTLWVVE